MPRQHRHRQQREPRLTAKDDHSPQHADQAGVAEAFDQATPNGHDDRGREDALPRASSLEQRPDDTECDWHQGDRETNRGRARMLHTAHDRDVEQHEAGQRHGGEPHPLTTFRTPHPPSSETKEDRGREGVANALGREQRRVHERP